MSVDLQEPEVAHVQDNDVLVYRRLAPSAVASFAIAALAWVAMLDWGMLVVPVVGVAAAIYALSTIRRRSDEFTGETIALAGLALSGSFLLLGPAVLIHERIKELPEGYTRIDYSILQPNPDNPREAIPASAVALDGQQVFIKGYIYPGGREIDGIKQFVLVRDQGDCCFGGNPKITDRIQVTLADPERLTFASHLHKVAGVLRVAKSNQSVAGIGGVFYHLEEAHLR